MPVPPGIGDREREVIWHRCALRAEAWLNDEGLQARLNYFHQSTDPAVDGEEMCAGVWWDVVVGRAVSTDAPDRGDMNVVHGLAWTWSARWAHWHAWFKSMAARERAEARAYTSGDLVQLSTFRSTPPWDRGDFSVDDEALASRPAIDPREYAQRAHARDVESDAIARKCSCPSEMAATDPWCPLHGSGQ